MGSWNVAWLPIIKPRKECIFPNYNQEAADGKKNLTSKKKNEIKFDEDMKILE